MSEVSPQHRRLAIVSEAGAGPFSAAITIGDHHLSADEPVALGGLNSGPDPYEFLLAGLGACTTMTLRLYAARKYWPLEHIEVRVRHRQSANATGTQDVFERELLLVGPLSGDQRARLLAIADKCPVSRTLSAGALVETSMEAASPSSAVEA